MAKQTDITVLCEEARIVPARYNQNRAILENISVPELLSCIDGEDIFTHIRSEGHKPEDVFEEEDLNEWAWKNGFTKSKQE
jgi:hypothetical protein